MARALDALHRSDRTGQGGLVVISGVPGIGKTALLRSVVDEASHLGFRTGTGRAEEGDQIAPGAPLLVALRSGPQPLLPGDAFASLAPLYDRPLWLVDRIGSLLEELAVHAPVLIAIDDLQWADRMTRFALRVLPARLAASPVVWVLTSRTGRTQARDEVIAGNDDAAALTRIDLGPLSAEAIGELAADRLGTPLPPDIRRLLDGVGGNPFWAVQVVDGLVRRRDSDQDAADLHAELSADVRARVGDLSDRAAALVRLAAVWGRALPVTDAARLLGDVSEAQVGALTREGAEHGLLGHADGEVFFPHDLVREALYADITPEDRHALHRRCARYLVEAGPHTLAAAVHFRASAVRDDDEAVEALLDAAEQCATSMPDQSAELAQTAFGLTSAGTPLWHRAGERTVKALVDLRRERQALDIAERLLAAPTTAEQEARIALQACRALWCAGDAEAMARRAAAALASDGVSPALRAQLAGAQALAASRTASAERAEAMAREALAAGHRLGDNESQRLAVVALIEAARNEGRHHLALERFNDLRRLSDTAYQAEEIRTLQHLDRYDDAEAMLAKIREAHEDVDTLLPPMLYAQMWQDHNLARLDAAEAGARTLLRLADETGNSGFSIDARMVLAAVATYRGDRAASAELLAPVAGDAGPASSPRMSLTQGLLRTGAGDVSAGLAVLAPLLARAEDFRDPWPWSPPWLRIIARIALRAGRIDVARKAADVADTAARRNPGVASLQGTALHIRGSLSDDPEPLRQAVAVLRDSPRPLLLADALVDLGIRLLPQGRMEEGTGALTEAADLYRRTGVTSGLTTVSKTLRANGLRDIRISPPTRRPPTGWAALTPTEMRVVELISSGHTNRSAAAELAVSPNTVNTHLRAVFRKLGVRSRVQLTIAFRDRPA